MASALSAILTQLATDIETTSITKCYIGNAGSSTITPRAELYLGTGEITDYLTNVQDRTIPFMVLVVGKSQEVTEVALAELIALWRNTAKLAALRALNVTTIYATTPASAQIFAGSVPHQPVVADIEFTMTVRYS